ncbi:MAG: hypothetical protein ACI8P9_004948, partial [Parasphingorhabdus sp.]
KQCSILKLARNEKNHQIFPSLPLDFEKAVPIISTRLRRVLIGSLV